MEERDDHSGRDYRHINISGSARAHLGDNITLDDPLARLPYANEAPFNAYVRQDEPACLQNTRSGVLEEIYGWAEGQDDRCIFWMNGLAGSGKSTISRTIARTYSQESRDNARARAARLGASFFFSRGTGGDVISAKKFFTTIAVQLAQYIPRLREIISGAVRKNIHVGSQSLEDQWRQLILAPLLELDKIASPSAYVLVVDALDECDDEYSIKTIIRLLTEAKALRAIRLRVFLTSRPEDPIWLSIKKLYYLERQEFILHEVAANIIDHDIYIYLIHSLSIIATNLGLGEGWPGEEDVAKMVRSANGLFIWAATACRFIETGKRFALKRLAAILNDTLNVQSSAGLRSGPVDSLSKIYIDVLRSSFRDYTEEEKEICYEELRKVLGTVILLFSPLSPPSLASFIGVSIEDLYGSLEGLHSILQFGRISQVSLEPIRLHHPSFRDFLLSKDRCGEDFWVDKELGHRSIAEYCLRIMNASLKKNICGLKTPGAIKSELEENTLQRCLPAELQYACTYWAQHVQLSGIPFAQYNQVHEFLKVHLLHWLEALSLIGRLQNGIDTLKSLEAFIQVGGNQIGYYNLIRDARHSVIRFRHILEEAPLQFYYSVLVFSSRESEIRKFFEDQRPSWLKIAPIIEENGYNYLETLLGHSDAVLSVAFSPDGQILASGSLDKTVKLWDPSTGMLRATLFGHSGGVNKVLFSPDGLFLASGAEDGVMLWNPATEKPLEPLEDHLHSVMAIAVSSSTGDCQFLAAAVKHENRDCAIRMWNIKTGKLCAKEISDIGTFALSFSPDGLLLASGGMDGKVKLWDTNTIASGLNSPAIRVLGSLSGHTGLVFALAFSAYGQLASGGIDATVRLWDLQTGEERAILYGHTDGVASLAFSGDGQLLASASDDTRVKIWNSNTGELLTTFSAHSDGVYGVAFSPLAIASGQLLASGSQDGMIRLWETNEKKYSSSLSRPNAYDNDLILRVGISSNGQLAASKSHKIVNVWNLSSEEPRLIYSKAFVECHRPYGTAALALSPDGRFLAEADTSSPRIEIWEAATGNSHRSLSSFPEGVSSLAFSPNSQFLAVTEWSGKRVSIWDLVTGTKLRDDIRSGLESMHSIKFSPDGQLLAIWGSNAIEIWYLKALHPIRTIGVGEDMYSVSFSSNVPYLQTNDGLVQFEPTNRTFLNNQTPRPHEFALRYDRWLLVNGKRILWIPPEYFPGSSPSHIAREATNGSRMVFGLTPDKITVVDLVIPQLPEAVWASHQL